MTDTTLAELLDLYSEGELTRRLTQKDRLDKAWRVAIKKYLDKVPKDKRELNEMLYLASEDNKRKIRKYLEHVGLLDFSPMVCGFCPEVSRFLMDPVLHDPKLLQNDTVAFEAKIKLGNETFIGEQFLIIELEPPKFTTAIANGVNPASIKYRYCDLPGIRILPEVTFKSNEIVVETRTELTNLFTYKCMNDDTKEEYEELIGQSAPLVGKVYNPVTEKDLENKVYSGYQTFRTSHRGLRMVIPLPFDHNQNPQSRLAALNFASGTLSVSGRLAKSVNIIKAASFGTNISDGYTPIEADPLGIASMQLWTNHIDSGTEMYSLYRGKFLRKYIRQVEVQETSYKKNDIEGGIKITGQGSYERFQVAVRPATYKNDFYRWKYLSEVVKECTYVPIMNKNDAGNPVVVSVNPIVTYRPIEIVKTISFGPKDTPTLILNNVPAEFLNKIYDYNARRRFGNDYLSTDDYIYNINFNSQYGGERIAGLLNTSRNNDMYINMTFVDGTLIPESTLLAQPLEVLIFKDKINELIATESAMGTIYR